MSTETSRIGIQRTEDSSAVKQFLQDQLGVLLTVVGGVPIFFEYFGLIEKPHTVSEPALRALSLTLFLISSMLILFIYGERRHFIRERRVYCLILGILFMFAGLALLAIYVYEPTYNKLILNYKSSDNYQLFLYGPQSATVPLPLPDGGASTLTISYTSYLITVLIVLVWILIVSRLIFLINRRIREANLQEPKRYNQVFKKKYTRPWRIRVLLTLRVLKEEEIIDTGHPIIAKDVKNGISFPIFLLIFFGFLLAIYAVFMPVYPKWFMFLEVPSVVISPRKVSLLATGIYILYYPFLVTGIVLMATVIFGSFERRRNFYQNINRLSEHFYVEVEKMVASVVEFEVWFDKQELRYREGKLLGKNPEHTRDDAEKDDDTRTSQVVSNELDENDVKEAQRLFVWQVMRAKIEYYRKLISNFSKIDGRLLKVSGDLLDDIFKYYMPRDADQIQEFKAVSAGDIQFWKKRGEEYIEWNKGMITAGVQVSRIFLIKKGDYFKGEDNEDEMDNFSVLFNQVELGIRVYICYEEEVMANDGTHFGLTSNDFGVYPKFAISFFDKPLRVGGRSLLMAFDENVIKDFTERYEQILKKCRNTNCINIDIGLIQQKKKLNDSDSLLQRYVALKAYLIDNWAKENFDDGVDLVNVKDLINNVATKYMSSHNPPNSAAISSSNTSS